MTALPNRRAALGALAAGAAFGLPSTSLALAAAGAIEAPTDDSAVYAAADRVKTLFRAIGEQSDRVEYASGFVEAVRPKTIVVSEIDHAWGCSARVGSPMPPDDIKVAQLAASKVRRDFGVDAECAPEMRSVLDRLVEIDDCADSCEIDRSVANKGWLEHHDTLDALQEAQQKLLASRPKTRDGLRILIQALIESEAFDCIESDEFARALVKMPVLTGLA